MVLTIYISVNQLILFDCRIESITVLISYRTRMLNAINILSQHNMVSWLQTLHSYKCIHVALENPFI